LDAEEAKIKSEIENLLEKLNKKAAEVLAVLTMFSIANNPTHSLWSSDIHSGQHRLSCTGQ
jgi:hypothetical protein